MQSWTMCLTAEATIFEHNLSANIILVKDRAEDFSIRIIEPPSLDKLFWKRKKKKYNVYTKLNIVELVLSLIVNRLAATRRTGSYESRVAT